MAGRPYEIMPIRASALVGIKTVPDSGVANKYNNCPRTRVMNSIMKLYDPTEGSCPRHCIFGNWPSPRAVLARVSLPSFLSIQERRGLLLGPKKITL